MHKRRIVIVTSTIALIFGLAPHAARSAIPKKETKTVETCTAAMEFVTALEFLRSRGEQWLSEANARKVAQKVATGCSGAGARFIRVTQVLSKAGLTPADSIETAAELATKSNAEAEAFVSVFQKAFLSEYLDLDMNSALKMARSLSVEFKGDVLKVRDDFETLLEYCINSKKIELPVPACGALAARVAKLGEEYSGGTAAPFIKSFEFLRSNKGPDLATGDALKLSEELISLGYGAVDNFTTAFRYAYSKTGLNLDRNQSIAFSKEMAKMSQKPIN